MLLDTLHPMPAFGPIDLSAGNNVGEYVSLKGYGRVIVAFWSGVGTAGDDPVLTLKQAKDRSGTGLKVLNFTTIYSKQAADLTVVGTFTKITQAASNTYSNLTAAENQTLWLVEIAATDLDTANAFTDIQASVPDVGSNAQLGGCLYLLGSPKLRSGPEFLVSPLID